MQIMKIDDGRPYHNNVFHKHVSNGGPKIDGEIERETKQHIFPDTMVQQTNPSEYSAGQQNGDKVVHIRPEDVSYDKDVVEINLPDIMVSSNYGVQFVKDVCIDEGVLADQKVTAEKLSPNLDSSMGDTNGVLMKETAEEREKSVNDLKSQIIVLPEACGTDGDTVEQYSSNKLHDLEGNNTIDEFNVVNVEKSRAKQVVSNEGAEYGQEMCASFFENGENHEPILDGEANNQVSSNNCHESGASVASVTTNPNGLPVESIDDGFSEVVTEDDVAGMALNKIGINQNNHYNPFIAYGSLEDTWEPKYSLPPVVDDASILPCPVEKTDSFSDILNGALRGFNFLETGESNREDSTLNSVEENSSSMDVEASEENNDQRESPVENTESLSNPVDRALSSTETDEARNEDSRLDCTEASSSRSDVQPSGHSNDQVDNLVDGIRTNATHGTGSVTSHGNTDPGDAKSDNHPKCKVDNVQDVHDFNPREEGDVIDISEDSKDSKSSTQTQSVAQQNEPDSAKVTMQTESIAPQNEHESAKVTARNVIRNPFESSFSGPSITSGPLTPSGHIPYSGNISLRSDSSTTSTRSFAFPVLQTEWNSSPVKMAKADRRRLRRDRGWGYRILCCKF
ncbi:uncharacterized protein LOC102716401 [Oryza brachyantha]|uniref:Uncharacterized protein n=1 Tax=Oryza brachyantha TaxID=4533 RepID=J3LYQ4_ORYBR|nr:uncharacterized protein LOC102716401 [Oryza brachyantha]